MAELHVEPKKKTSILPWILLLLGLAALIWFLTRDKGNDTTVANTATTDTSATTSTTNTSTSNNAARADWTGVDFNAPAANYEEITDRNIQVRGNESYGIYGVGENILFDEGKATIRQNAEANLRQIVSSIGKRYSGGEVRVYGFTDAQGSAGANKELAQQRADAVKAWLQNNGIEADRISVNAIGEAQPVASNSTEQGRQQNRRVEIVARGGGNTRDTQQ
jgi:outer membrane protein OmpA-like peptidoglycan-associated protein